MVEHEPRVELACVRPAAHANLAVQGLCRVNGAPFFCIIKCASAVRLVFLALEPGPPEGPVELLDRLEVLLPELPDGDAEELRERPEIALSQKTAAHRAAMGACTAATGGSELLNLCKRRVFG